MTIKSLYQESYFDWYQGTFSDEITLDYLKPKLLDHYSFADLVSCKPQVRQYSRAVNLQRGDHVLVHLCWGGCNGQGLHFKATGYTGQLFFEFLRINRLSKYALSRADVRMDSKEVGIFDYMDRVATKFAIQNNIVTNTQGDWKTGKLGRTLYIGSKSSKAQIRIYEKGKQLKSNPEWARLEIQVRPPKKHDKERCAIWEPSDFWSVVPWTHRFINTLMVDKTIPDVLPIKTVWNKSSHQQKVSNMVRQYGNTLEDLADSLPYGWDDIGPFLAEFKKIYDQDKSSGGLDSKNPFDDVLLNVLNTSKAGND